MINFEIVDGTSVPVSQSFFCETMASESETWCISDNPIPAGTYTIEVRSPSDDKWTDGTPKLLTYYVDNKDYCEGSEYIYTGQSECNFEILDVSADGQSYTVVVDVREFTPKENGWYFAVGFEVEAMANRDISVRLLEYEVEFFCSSNEGFGSGRDVGCYADEDKAIAPMLYTMEVKNIGDERWSELPTIKGIVFGGHDVCQGHESTSGGMGGHGHNAKCSFSENMAADKQSYTINNIKTDEAGVWKFVFDKPDLTINFEIVDGTSVPVSQSFFCETMPSESETWCISDNSIPAGTYTIEVKSPSDDKWTDGTPELLTYYVDNKDYCEGHESTSGGMGGHGDNAKCSFSEDMAADKQSYTIRNIKTDEAGVWKFVFDKAYMTINFEIVDGGSVPITQSFFCSTMPSETWCISDNSIPAGTYTIEVRSPSDDKWTDGTPKLLTYYVDNKDYCEGGHDYDNHESMGSHGDAKCDFSNIDSVDDQFYNYAGIKTDEEGILKFVFYDSNAAVKLSLKEEKTEFDACVNGECPTKTPVPAGTYTVEVQYI